MQEFHSNAIFWVDVDKISPNPFQPRKVFNEASLQDLADSIRQYGVLQPLVVTRQEDYSPNGGMTTRYELIAGERRLRASKIAGVAQVPVVIRSGEESDSLKLELAIIENLQREDLNPIDRAQAFKQLVDDYGYKHTEVAKKMGRSREYVSNSLRLLQLPDEMQQAVMSKEISEGHTRPLLMLNDRPEEQQTLFKEIKFKKLTVRDAEEISRRIAIEKVRKPERELNPDIIDMERETSERLGTRVEIRKRAHGGRLMIEFSSDEDLKTLLEKLQHEGVETHAAMAGAHVTHSEDEIDLDRVTDTPSIEALPDSAVAAVDAETVAHNTERQKEEKEDDEWYSLDHFSV